jgi:peroxiredoxin Q/BCP
MGNPIRVGDKAPEFKAIAVGGRFAEGAKVKLDDYRGKTLVLYFYPEDDAPGCIAQACAIQESWSAKGVATELLGVTTCSTERQAAFHKEYSLPFPLVGDELHEMVEAYGVWVEQRIHGELSFGTERTAFIIGPDSHIVAVLRRIKPATHPAMMMEAIALQVPGFEFARSDLVLTSDTHT